MSKKINAKLLAEGIALIITAMGGDSAVNEAEDASEEEEAPRGRGRPKGSTAAAKKTTSTKKPAGKKADPLEEEEEEEEEEDLGLGEEEEELTQEDVVAAFKALKASHGLDKCKEVLAKMDESNVLNIAPKNWPATMKEIQRAASKKK